MMALKKPNRCSDGFAHIARITFVFACLAFKVLTAFSQPLQPEVLYILPSFPDSLPGFMGPLVQCPDGAIYGTSHVGIQPCLGIVFQLKAGGAFTPLFTFDEDNFNNTNGEWPNGLTLGPDGNLYGTTQSGGANGYGTLFQVTTNGALTPLLSFGGTNGSPFASLIVGKDGNFYGTTAVCGSYGFGTIFRCTTNWDLTTLASFDGTNGATTYSGLAQGADGSFYGTTAEGGTSNWGTVFRLSPDGALNALVSFTGPNGRNPQSALTLASDGNFYGTTSMGGDTNNDGTVFRITTNGVLTTLLVFAGTNGACPYGGLTEGPDGNLYGMTMVDYRAGYGSIYQATTSGTLTTLAWFGGTNGARPYSSLIFGSDGDIYGATAHGGQGAGVLFRLRHGAYVQSFGMATNGFQINVLNVGGSGTVVLEASTDLNSWTPILTNGTGAAQQFLDSSPAHLQRFYRVAQR